MKKQNYLTRYYVPYPVQFNGGEVMGYFYKLGLQVGKEYQRTLKNTGKEILYVNGYPVLVRWDSKIKLNKSFYHICTHELGEELGHIRKPLVHPKYSENTLYDDWSMYARMGIKNEKYNRELRINERRYLQSMFKLCGWDTFDRRNRFGIFKNDLFYMAYWNACLNRNKGMGSINLPYAEAIYQEYRKLLRRIGRSE